MITAIMETSDNEATLVQALSALVPAATQGIIREVVVVDHGSRDGTRLIADAAGCTIVEADRVAGDAVHRAAEQARGDWLLFLSPTVPLTAGWQNLVMAFIDRSLMAGRVLARPAIFCRGVIVTGWRARVLGLLALVEGRLISKTAYLSASAASRASVASLASGARRGAA